MDGNGVRDLSMLFAAVDVEDRADEKDNLRSGVVGI